MTVLPVSSFKKGLGFTGTACRVLEGGRAGFGFLRLGMRGMVKRQAWVMVRLLLLLGSLSGWRWMLCCRLLLLLLNLPLWLLCYSASLVCFCVLSCKKRLLQFQLMLRCQQLTLSILLQLLLLLH
jgi:hypothetical protein